MGRIFELPEPRHSNITNLRPRFSPRHPSVRSTCMFDQDDPDLKDRVVTLTELEAQLIASLLNTARPHLPSPRAVESHLTAQGAAMSCRWPNDERPTFPLNHDSASGVLFLLLGLGILILTPPASMSPWVFFTACVGFIAGLVFIALGYRQEME